MPHRDGQKVNNKNKNWTNKQVQKLKKLAAGNTPTHLIADAVGRTVEAVRSKAYEVNVSLKPVNKSPYNHKKRSQKASFSLTH